MKKYLDSYSRQLSNRKSIGLTKQEHTEKASLAKGSTRPIN